ncbi:hypothetical protein RO3G_09925 [Rhizopus delemar RA 99-880]|uniref:Uncharacterized protein n=1 Tax=Rhizopus delemar (strain RA 99-880 / ATCC MYA-4621 / FGSC 9543 / NRRL 43880) TaxID=246409 RepID=I1C9T5_RHIO9|nr:hypothetical protein RO3G_09925 [Rhizopus delemar RA 99-880]|eukprot:EIE85215.1 hypothetical protein RO3G_09925 [Rhizopus delemar RA 99-880]
MYKLSFGISLNTVNKCNIDACCFPFLYLLIRATLLWPFTISFSPLLWFLSTDVFCSFALSVQILASLNPCVLESLRP